MTYLRANLCRQDKDNDEQDRSNGDDQEVLPKNGLYTFSKSDNNPGEEEEPEALKQKGQKCEYKNVKIERSGCNRKKLVGNRQYGRKEQDAVAPFVKQNLGILIIIIGKTRNMIKQVLRKRSEATVWH